MADSMSDSKLFAFIAYLWLIGFIIALVVKRNDRFVMYHAKQSLVLIIASLIVSVFSVVPFIGWVLAPILSVLLIILWVLGVIAALQGQQKPLPVIGKYADMFKF